MTNRQKKIGVTQYGYQRGIKDNEFLSSNEAFLAKIATLKKGQYKGMDIIAKWFGYESEAKLEQLKPYFYGVTAVKSEYFNYTDTHGLDLLTIK